MNKQNRDFKGVWIPAEIWFDKDLNITEKVLLVEIDSLDNEKGCFATNKYFASFLNKSKSYISRCISKLKENGYIYEEDFDGRKRVLKSCINIYAKADLNNIRSQTCTKPQGSFEQGGKGGNSENADDASDNKEKKSSNNTLINLNNNTSNKKEDSPNCPHKKIKKLYNDICTSLPSIRKMSEQRKKHVGARWKEEEDIEVFKEVFEKAENSSFLTGNNNRNWTADFDWIVKNDTNFNKILEGKYDDKNKSKKYESTVDDDEIKEMIESLG